jgi:hypothetical protein
MLATVNKKNNKEAIRNSATADAFLSAIRLLWKRLYPKAEPFSGAQVDELEHYSNALQLEFSVLADSPTLPPAEKRRLTIQLELCSKIIVLLLRQCRSG